MRRGWKGESRYFLLNDLRNNKRDYPMMVQRYVALAFEQNAVPKADDIPVLKPYLTVDPTQQAETLKTLKTDRTFRQTSDYRFLPWCRIWTS